ncbi:MAG TPA: hypothetical protein VKV95_22255 [Terriglobia bacterium]|nr:hypothetical protein [Terriglobia bacterium]
MNIVPKAESPFATRSAASLGAPERDAAGRLEINVIHTTARGTLAALKTAGELAFDLGARINLLAPKLVPWALPLTRPPVAVGCIENQLCELVCKAASGVSDVSIHVLLCRDKQRALIQALKLKSLVVIGGQKPWWPGEKKSLVKRLSRYGHRVIFAGER